MFHHWSAVLTRPSPLPGRSARTEERVEEVIAASGPLVPGGSSLTIETILQTGLRSETAAWTSGSVPEAIE
jgi:hypothetical protein